MRLPIVADSTNFTFICEEKVRALVEAILPTRFYPLRGCSAKKCSDKVRQRTIGEKPWAKKSLVNPRRAIESFLHKELFLHQPFSANMDQTLLGPVHFHTNCHTQHSNDSIKPSDMSQFLVYTKCCQLCQNDNSYFNWTSLSRELFKDGVIIKFFLWTKCFFGLIFTIVCFPGTLIELQWT